MPQPGRPHEVLCKSRAHDTRSAKPILPKKILEVNIKLDTADDSEDDAASTGENSSINPDGEDEEKEQGEAVWLLKRGNNLLSWIRYLGAYLILTTTTSRSIVNQQI